MTVNTVNHTGESLVAHNTSPNTQENKNARKGFASMSMEKKRAIASAGGKAAHKNGNAHKFDSAKASEAGRKGGQVVSQNREHMAMIGKRGGENRSKKNVQNNNEPPAPNNNNDAE